VVAAGLLAGTAAGCRPDAAPGKPEEFRENEIVVRAVFAPQPVSAGAPADATMGVFLTVGNRGDVDDTLAGVEAPLAAKAQLHGTMSRGDMTMMMPLAALPVPRHAEVRLRPGGMHIMLEGLRDRVSAGDMVPLVLIFRHAGRVPIRARVVRYDQLGQSLSAGDTTPSAEPLLRLRRSDGRVFDLAHERGNVVLIFFGYTHCPDICPVTLANFVWVRRRLGPRAERVRFVFVTVDPGRDSPERAMAYARQFDSTFVGLSGDSTTLAAVERSFHAASWVSRDSAGNVLVAHSASTYVVGSDGRLARVIPYSEADVDRLYAAVNDALRT
jgi:protein SCO1/2